MPRPTSFHQQRTQLSHLSSAKRDPQVAVEHQPSQIVRCRLRSQPLETEDSRSIPAGPWIGQWDLFPIECDVPYIIPHCTLKEQVIHGSLALSRAKRAGCPMLSLGAATNLVMRLERCRSERPACFAGSSRQGLPQRLDLNRSTHCLVNRRYRSPKRTLGSMYEPSTHSLKECSAMRSGSVGSTACQVRA